MMIDEKKLCLKLARANTSNEVIKILKKEKIWDDQNYWEHFDKNPNNFSQIGAQQSNAINALVEKFINQGDSILINECLKSKIDPKDAINAPTSLKKAMEAFLKVPNGDQSQLSEKERTALAKKCGGVCVTGDKDFPTYAIFDFGEGQNPDDFEKTFLALSRSNKTEIAFVQGKHCTGGTGSLLFSDDGIQMIISRRNPNIRNTNESDEIGWTITRKFPASGTSRSDTVKYLVINNKIPRFDFEPLQILPKENKDDPFSDYWEYGAFIKLYSYDIGPTIKSVGNMDLVYKLSLNMVSPVFPLRFYERRGVKGHSPEINMNGLEVRLKEDRGGNIEPNPFSINFSVDYQNFSGEIYVVKPEANFGRWHGNEGLLFTLNGQTNAFEKSDFFSRKAVNMDYLRKNLLVLIDCTNIDNEHINKMFMNNRESSRQTAFKKTVEKELEEIIRNHSGLKKIKEKYRTERIQNKLSNNKPLAETVNKLLKKAPILSKVLSGGSRLNNPINTSSSGTSGKFIGNFYPTFFDLEKSHSKFTKNKPREVQLTRKSNFTFNTDANNDFLTRKKHPGSYDVYIDGNLINSKPSFYGSDGIWHLQISTPSSPVGTIHEIRLHVNCLNSPAGFGETFYIEVKPFVKTTSSSSKKSKKKGSGNKKGSSPQNLSLPTFITVSKDDVNWKRFNFTNESALAIEKNATGTGYDYYINDDNIVMKNEMALAKKEPEVIKNLYQSAMLLYAMTIASKDSTGKLKKLKNFDLTEYSKSCTEAFSLVAIPIALNLANEHEDL